MACLKDRSPPIAGGVDERATADVDRLMADIIADHNARYHPGQNCPDDDLDECAVRAAVEATDPAPNPVPPPAVSAAELRAVADRRKDGER